MHNSKNRLEYLRKTMNEDGEANAWRGYKGSYMGYESARIREIVKDSEAKSYKYYEKMCKNCGFHAVDLCSYDYHDKIHLENSQTNLIKKLNEYAPGTKMKYKNRVRSRIMGSVAGIRYMKSENGELSCAALMLKKRIRNKERAYYHEKLQEIEAPFALEDNQTEPEPEKIELDLNPDSAEG